MTPVASDSQPVFRAQTLAAIGSRAPTIPSFSPFRRKPARSVVLEINPFQILVACIHAAKGGITVVDHTAEFAVDDDDGLAHWLDERFGPQREWVSVIGSVTSPELVLQRENLQGPKLADADYLPALLRERLKANSTTPWTTAALDPLAGTPLQESGNTNPGLLLGLAQSEIDRFQQRLLRHRLVPRRIELGLLPLLGTIYRVAEARQERRATVVVVIEEEQTTAYIVGKEGVHTPMPVSHGFGSIVQTVRKEFGLTDATEVRDRLHHPDDELLLRATKFVRAIGRDLKPLVDSYEMTTGQPVGEIHCAYLPDALQWIVEPLAQVIQRTAMTVDTAAWLSLGKLQAADDLPPLGPQWLGALSVVAAPASDPTGAAAGPVPWRLDFRFPAQMATTGQIRRQFRRTALLTTLATACAGFALWQWSVIRAYNADTDYWRQQIASNQGLFDELRRATTALRVKTDRFNQAEALMRKPIGATDFILNLGRTLPPNMEVERIEATAGGRIAMSGHLHEPPDQSSVILGRYMEELRRTPAIGPLFSSIALTALQRENDSDDSLTFEISFTPQEATP
jgi:hypothetical protein